jgi:hypothetical protein
MAPPNDAFLSNCRGPRPSRRPTIADTARAAEVSVAAVDPVKFFWNDYSDLDYVWNVCYTRWRRPRLTGCRRRGAHAKPNGASAPREETDMKRILIALAAAPVLSSPAFATGPRRQTRNDRSDPLLRRSLKG